MLQLDEAADVQVATLLVLEKVDRHPRGLEHVDAGDPRAGLDLQDAAQDDAERIGQVLLLRREVDGGHDDRRRVELARDGSRPASAPGRSPPNRRLHTASGPSRRRRSARSVRRT